MVPAIHNYWLGIMAAAFAAAMAVWIWLVLRADKHPHGYSSGETRPLRREVLGGAFVARDGGRQVVPDRREPPESGPLPSEPAATVPARADVREGPEPEPDPTVPGQRQAADDRAANRQRATKR